MAEKIEHLIAMLEESNGPLGEEFQTLCAPIENILDLSAITIYSLTKSGEFKILSTRPDWHQLHIQAGQFFKFPFFKNPDFYDSGFALSSGIDDESYQSAENALAALDPAFSPSLLLATKKYGKDLIGCGFAASKQQKTQNNQNFINRMPLITRLAEHLIAAAKPLLKQLQTPAINLKELQGEAFDQGEKLIFSPPKLTIEQVQMLEEMGVLDPGASKLETLTKRELEIAVLYLEHLNMADIARALKLSPRTVEHHFESIKSKFKIAKIRDLSRMLLDLKTFGAL